MNVIPCYNFDAKIHTYMEMDKWIRSHHAALVINPLGSEPRSLRTTRENSVPALHMPLKLGKELAGASPVLPPFQCR